MAVYPALLEKKVDLTRRRARYDTHKSRGIGAEDGWGPEEWNWRPEEGGGGLRKRAKGLGVVGAKRGLGP